MSQGPSERNAGEESGEIATSTLAEIYAQQGLLGRALAIYRRLLSRAPDDGAIADRIESLERRLVEAEDEAEVETSEVEGGVGDPDAGAARGSPAPEASEPAPRERLPWDPPEEDEGEPGPPSEEEPRPPPGGAGSPPAVGPIDPRAFDAWLERH